ncbi:hypothetical protein AXF42_Ash005557 [Apostasia shenzhenica]|uniref:Uncharacterized protein n=1 Tax=Apostasia shenzhenica TaxID=1088818 RepID=A0A2I0B7A5_9ASPA|nr:hypothetical protein AXF42_Ash005557 [Apostasia shenzhenica]
MLTFPILLDNLSPQRLDMVFNACVACSSAAGDKFKIVSDGLNNFQAFLTETEVLDILNGRKGKQGAYLLHAANPFILVFSSLFGFQMLGSISQVPMTISLHVVTVAAKASCW